MNAVIIYDVSGKEPELKAWMMGNMGYYDKWIDAEKRVVNLPSRTIWKPNVELDQAVLDIRSAIEQLNRQFPSTPITLERCLVLPNNPWQAIIGVPIPQMAPISQ